MKKIYNIVLLSIVSILMYSCDTTNEADYAPSTYIAPASFTLEENTASTEENSFVVTYSPTAKGEAYLAVLPGGSEAPTSTNIHGGSGFQQAINTVVDGETPVEITIDSNIYGGYTYDVYAIHKSDDNLISETVTKVSVTTPDTEKPLFLGDDSSPYFEQGSVNPFAPVTFTFSEPVFYQGGDITFSAFGSERTVIVNDASALSTNGTSITVNTHGTFEQDDFIIVTWDEGTFKDNADKSVDALTGFGHYFKTRVFTAPEAAALMVGRYNYEAVMYADNIESFYTAYAQLFLQKTGEFELKLDPSDASGTTLLGVNVFSPLIDYDFPATANHKIKFGQEGEIAILDELQTCGIPFDGIDSVSWRHYLLDAFTANPGFYDVTEGTINHYLSLVVTDTGATISDIDYNYTRVGTYAKSTPKLQKELKVRNEFLNKKREINSTYSKKEYKVINIVK